MVPDTPALEAARASGLIAAGRPLVVLLSGGRDSTCLLDVAIAIAGAPAVRALHVNHGLRPGAARDERHCAELCERLGVALDVERADRPPSGNVQAWARELRYAAADRLAAERDADVAVGHTASDQVETILYRLATRSGRRALLGMAPRSGRRVRPLLAVTREQTAAHCRARGLTWIEDPSNADPGFARARVRSTVVPALRSLHPAAEANVLATAAQLREEADVLDDLVDAALRGRDHVDAGELRALAPALRRLVVARLAERVAGRPVTRAGERVDELLELAARGGRAALDVGEGVRMVVDERGIAATTTPPLPDARGR